MLVSDILLLLQWWFVFFLFGILFFPFTSRVLSNISHKGYVFSKIIGIAITSYSIFILGILHIVAFSQISAICITLSLGILCFIENISVKKQRILIKKVNFSYFYSHWKSICSDEIIFLGSLLFWSFIRIHQPDIHGLEKYMDFGFVNSILRTAYFPPKDMWFTPFSINYYYFGHLITAVLTKISGIPSSHTYNLMIATLFALTLTYAYTITTTLISFLHLDLFLPKNKKNTIFTFLTALVTAALMSLSGNLHILYIFFTPYNTEHPVPFTKLLLALKTIPNAYWYPNATRFIYNTIHEFPIYSFVVSDLHGHVLDIPIVLTIIVFLLQLFFTKKITFFSLIFLSFLLSIAYMTNAWDGAIYLLLSIFVIIYIQIVSLHFEKRNYVSLLIKQLLFRPSFFINTVYYSMIILAGFFLFALPFSLFFQTGALVHGIGVLCAPTFLTNIQHIGPFLFEVDHCQKSPLWQLLILYGFFYFFVLSFFIFLQRIKKIIQTDIFIVFLIFLSTLLIIIPEFIYVKDIYPAHYRANTMFKLTYEAFIMLSLTTGYIIVRLCLYLPSIKTILGKAIISIFILSSGILLTLVFIYPTFAINSYYENLSKPKNLDGILYLKMLHPDDYVAIMWINTHIKNQPIIAEAQGDSYTDYGRISTNTGLPTILGWTVHEWLWRGSYDIPAPRIAEVQTLYETKDAKKALSIIKKYHVSYIYIGDLEREKYTKLSEKKFQKLGTVVYKKSRTTIYKIL